MRRYLLMLQLRKLRHGIIKWLVHVQSWDLNADPFESKISSLSHQVTWPSVWRAKERHYGLRPEPSSVHRTSKHLAQKENTINSLELGTDGVCSLWVL